MKNYYILNKIMFFFFSFLVNFNRIICFDTFDDNVFFITKIRRLDKNNKQTQTTTKKQPDFRSENELIGVYCIS